MMGIWVLLFLLVSSDAQSYDDNSEDPFFAEPIPNITIAAGSDVTLPCVVNNLGNYKLHWIHERFVLTADDWILTRDSRYSITRNDFGTWYLSIRRVEVSDKGEYTCAISTSPMIRQSGYLEVVVAPKIWIPNQLIGAPLGTDVLLDCGLESFPKSVTYWKKNGGIIILSNGKYDSDLLDSGIYQSKMQLRIRNLKQEDYGTYNCVAKNALGLTEGTITLFHNYPTTTFSTHITGNTGKTDAANKAELSTELYDKGFFISTPGGVAAAATSDYEYREQAANKAELSTELLDKDVFVSTPGSVAAAATSDDEYREQDAQSYDGGPFFAEPIPNITVAAGSDVIFPCVVNNLGHYMLGWMYKDKNFRLWLRERVIHRDPHYSITRNGSRTWLLHIKDVKVSHKGEYICHINTSPMISQSGYLEVVAANKAELSTELLDKDFFVSTPGDVAAAATSDNEYREQEAERKKSRLHHNNGTRNSRMNLLFGPFSLVGVLVVVGTNRTFM